jgi:tRNA 2-thiouridine synthesizing protein C
MSEVAVLMRRAPYGTVYTAEGLRTLMGIAVFEMEISVVFVDDGVYALVEGQAPGKLDMKPLGNAFPMLSEFGVTDFFVHDASLQERGLTVDYLVLDVTVIDGTQVAEILESAGKVLPF